MRTECHEVTPKTLPGTVRVQWVRCSRSNCCCARGELHGPYFYRVWRENGKVRKEYVKRTEVDKVRRQCNARKEIRRQLQKSWSTLRLMRERIREVEAE